jgi:hypothetical protein
VRRNRLTAAIATMPRNSAILSNRRRPWWPRRWEGQGETRRIIAFAPADSHDRGRRGRHRSLHFQNVNARGAVPVPPISGCP